MRKLRVGVVGLGRGRMFSDLFRAIPECELVAVCDPLPRLFEPFKGLACHTDYDRFLAEGLDLVAVVSPGPVHADQSVRALNAGAHVLCETPCVYSLDEARQVVEAVRRTGRSFMLAEDYLWMGWVVRMKEKAGAGAFGRIVYAEGDYTHDCRDYMLVNDAGFVPYADRAQHPEARKTWRATHLPPIYYTSHTLGPLLHLMDDRIVSAVGMSTGTHTAPDLGTIDLETALFQTAKGSIVRLTNGFTVAHPYSVYYNLVGSRGSMKWSSVGGFVWYTEAAEPRMTNWETAPKEWNDRPDGKNRVEVMIREFVTSIVNGTPPPLDVHRSLDFVLPGLLAHDSALRGSEKIEVPDLRPHG